MWPPWSKMEMCKKATTKKERILCFSNWTSTVCLGTSQVSLYVSIESKYVKK